jgi:hypothetical protein
MMRFTKALPVCLRPEQLVVASMWLNVIDNGCGGLQSSALTHHAPWMRAKVAGTCLLPTKAIAAPRSTWPRHDDL